MEYTDLNGEIIPLIGGVSDPSIVRNVRNVAIDFAKRTKLITHEVELVVGDQLVVITPANVEERVFSVNWIKDGDTPLPVIGGLLANGTYRVRFDDPIPPGTRLTAQYTAIPTRDSTTCDDRIMDTWYETIVAGALSNLYGMKTATWFDPAMAESYSANYAQGIFDATINERNDDTRTTKYMAYGGI